ncbi:glycerophosphodiester phosphodiesterase family protein [Leucobacter luti]|uniref:glycerophosphodiester phosphodiesterase family protein n=1 Tax=Leucobacter luti TaxID=340320 RepID=UPI003D05507B
MGGVWRQTGGMIRDGVRRVRAGGWRLAGFLLATQLVIVGVAIPLIGWLFREAIRAGGMHGLDLDDFSSAATLPLTLLGFGVIVLIAFWLLALQFAALVFLLRWPEAGWREQLARLRSTARRLAHPRVIPLLLYLFLLLPLTGFGFASVLTQGIAIPSFISGELLKSPVSAIALTAFLLALGILNLRLALTFPAFALTDTRGPGRESLRLTRGVRGWLPLALATFAILFVGSLAGSIIILLALGPTAISDAISPDASHIVAAYSLGVAQVLGIFVSGLTTATLAGALVGRVVDRAEHLRPGTSLLVVAPGTPALAPQRGRRAPLIVLSAALVTALGFGTLSIGTMRSLSEFPDTLVLAHRGFSDGGVENTIGGLEAAAAANADLVEMDVMQTKDGEFIAMHDANLSRLADRPEAVKDLTLAELTKIEVRDQAGHTGLIPKFSDYVLRAKELGIPLLIEIKLGGADTPDHVERLVAELEELDALTSNIYHSLDPKSVARLKQLRPDLTVGYTMAFAGAEAPETPADFIVVEEWSATSGMQASAERAGLGFMAWTVNDDAGMRELLRRNIDGIITDHPDEALSAREEMQESTGLADVLLDALNRFVTVV